MTSSTPLLQARGLFCERDDRILFDGLSFSADYGEILQIEGPNGAGKTTLLRLISGLMPLHEGELLWKGKPVSEVRFDFISSLLFLGHKTGIKSLLSPLENLRIWCGARFSVDENSMIAALEAVGLGGYEEVPCHSLSAGQQRRAALARLHLSPVPVWILDEAFTAIDKQGVTELEGWIVDKAAQGGMVILTTHHRIATNSRLRKLQLGKGQEIEIVHEVLGEEEMASAKHEGES
ncbi:cytochrome c biogenesis heme-transporting ATPase CcmA [Hahella ganghwensis]|uniref:cytochrome c biogenesis heme-transporting ATPase CcmA n=1 Tax=Hahella ganghwensis TaxID=286420 RepID=UPI00037F8E6B|nr:cytochrome c biogenesis heme-transporting ATPase CcmA [Hahella ganghwensis]